MSGYPPPQGNPYPPAGYPPQTNQGAYPPMHNVPLGAGNSQGYLQGSQPVQGYPAYGSAVPAVGQPSAPPMMQAPVQQATKPAGPGAEGVGGLSSIGIPEPTCPMIYVAQDATGRSWKPCQITTYNLHADFHIGTCFADAIVDYIVPSDAKKGPGLFILPKHRDGVITGVRLENATTNNVFLTAVLSKQDVERNAQKSAKKNKKQDKADAAYEAVDEAFRGDPELFRMQVPALRPKDVLRLHLSFFQPGEFRMGSYEARLPTRVPAEARLEKAQLQQTITATINSGDQAAVKWRCHTHKLQPDAGSESLGGHVRLRQVPGADGPGGTEMVLAYSVWAQQIRATLNVQDPTGDDPRGTFCLAVAPPEEQFAQPFPRSIVFAVDCSGSMYGEPMKLARAGVVAALSQLSDRDYFNVIAYDHRQKCFQPGVVQATQKAVREATRWCEQNLVEQGMTDILTPLRQAADMLRSPDASYGIPYIFLLTDGAVQNERDICKWALSLKSDPAYTGLAIPRIHTMGIGPFCNHYFLKILAEAGRGFADVALRAYSIQHQIEGLMKASALPVLGDVALSIEGLTDCELYPFPVPDLYVNRPLVVSGKFGGHWPEKIKLTGVLPNGTKFELEVPSWRTAHIPLDKVFAKQQLDLTIGRAWLHEDERLQARAIEMSVKNNIPCVHTGLVGFEIPKSKMKEWEKAKSSKKGLSGGAVAGIAIGGAAAVGLIGVAVLTLGDVDMSAAGMAVGNVMMSVGGDVVEWVPDAFSGLAEGAADLAEAAGEGIGTAAEAVGELGGDMVDCCGDCCGEIFECMGELCGSIGDMC
ncbi:unnamed protein product [Pedinophyceae sp. YPF-701]|nr:unnamed protein product [Pedinophyceae sp. YPF-701]